MSTKDKDAAAKNVRELIRLGRLPPHPPTRIWAGYGPGSDPCQLCSTLVPADQVVMEAVFGADGENSLFFHRDCFHIADSEWRRLQGLEGRSVSASISASAAERASSAIADADRRADPAAATE